jgi:hypothetical protein
MTSNEKALSRTYLSLPAPLFATRKPNTTGSLFGAELPAPAALPTRTADGVLHASPALAIEYAAAKTVLAARTAA